MEMNTTVRTTLNFRYGRLGFPAMVILLLTATACSRGNVQAAAPPPPPVRVRADLAPESDSRLFVARKRHVLTPRNRL